MKPYFYKIQEITTGKYYVGCQYGKHSDPKNFWVTYFTSCKYVLGEDKSNFRIVKIQERSDAKSYEQRYLTKMYRRLGRENFCSIFINRNLSPGILLEGTALENLKRSLKKSWESESRRKLHLEHCQRMKKDGVYAKRVGVDPFSDETKQKISERMCASNPMSKQEVRNKHKEAVNTKKELDRKRLQAIGNNYTKGTRWYNNGVVSKMFREQPSDEWKLGRLKHGKCTQQTETN